MADPDIATVLVVSSALEPYNELASSKCRIAWTRQPSEAASKLAALKPDLIIFPAWLDPGPLRAELQTGHIPLLLVCSRGRVEEQMSSLNVQVSEFIVEGFTIEDLRIRVAWALARHDAEVAKAAQPKDAPVTKADLMAVRDNFLDILVYDIRSPLSSVLVGLEFLLSQQDLPAVQKKVVQRLNHSCTDLRTTLENFLDLERMEEMKAPFEKAPIDFKNLVKRATEPAKDFLATHGVQVQYEIAPNLPMVKGEEKAISRVLVNLVMNAGKMSDSGQPVMVRSQKQDAGVRFQVENRGQAIPNEVRDKIFDRYLHRGKAGWIFPRGFGTALSYSKRVVEGHGGKIWHEPAEPSGNSFNVFLPA